MVQVGAYQQAAGYYNQTVAKKDQQQAKAPSAKQNTKVGYVDKSKESTLSDKAQNVLKQLRAKYGNMDFMVADFENEDEAKATLAKGTKEFSVLFSSEELEKMAADEKYFNQKINDLEGAVRMSEEINQKYGFDQEEKDTQITKMGMVFHDDGTTSFFAELEKTSAKQKERIEKSREEKRTEKKQEAKKAEKDLKNYEKNNTETKRVTVWADSMQELVDKINAVDWDHVPTESVKESGGRYDFSV